MFRKKNKIATGVMLAANIALLGSIVTSSPVKAGMKKVNVADRTITTMPVTEGALQFISPFTGTKLTASQIESGFGIGRDIQALASLIVDDLNDGKYKTVDVAQGLRTMDLIYSDLRGQLISTEDAINKFNQIKDSFMTPGDSGPTEQAGFFCYGEGDSGKGFICGYPCHAGTFCSKIDSQEIVVNDFMQNLLDNMYGKDLYVQEMIRTNSAEIMQQVMEQMLN